jgi:hypothetical protein
VLGAAVVGTVLCAVQVPATAAQASTSRQARRYVESTETRPTSLQCAKPLSQRTGNWACLTTKFNIKPPRTSDGTVQPNLNSYCLVTACWTRETDFQTIMTGLGPYGYGSTTLGDITIQLKVTYSGLTAIVKPFTFYDTRGVSSLLSTGEMLYYSGAKPAGYPVEGGATYQCRETYNIGAETTVNDFGTNGYSGSSYNVTVSGFVGEWMWTDPSSAYPGQWYVTEKSPQFNNQNNDTYKLGNPMRHGDDPELSGWSSIVDSC